jgi:hypothetical protein
VRQLNCNSKLPVAKKPSIRLSKKLVTNDNQEMDYQFPAQSHLDQLMENDPIALAKLELKTIYRSVHCGVQWIFTLSDGTSSSLNEIGKPLTRVDLHFSTAQVAKVDKDRDQIIRKNLEG